MNEEEIEKFGRIYNLKSALQDKYLKAKEYKAKYSQREKDQFCRNDHMITTKHKEHQSPYKSGMTVNRVFLNAINGGNTDIAELKGEYEKNMKRHAEE